MKSILNKIIVLFFLVGVSDIAFLNAQNAQQTRLPSLGKHVFTSVTGIQDPFIKTRLNLSLGIADLVNNLNIPGSPEGINIKPELFYTVGGIEYQHAITDWAAIELKMAGLVRGGNNAATLALQGVSTASSSSIGLTFKLVTTRSLFFSGAIGLYNSSLTYIGLADALRIDESEPDKLLIENYQILNANLGFRFAFRFSDVVGLIANASGTLGEVYAGRNDKSIDWVFGSLLSIDMKNWFRIPFGIGLGGSVISNDWKFLETDRPVYNAVLKISYIYQNDFVLGLDNYLQMIHQNQFDQTLQIYYTRIYLGYYF